MIDIPKPEYFKAYFFVESPPESWPIRFGIVTAFNPDGRIQSEEANWRMDADLLRELTRAGLPHFRASGGARDGSYLEPGFGVVADSPEIIRPFSRAFHQDAFFWIADGEIFIVNTEGKTLHRVDTWAARFLA